MPMVVTPSAILVLASLFFCACSGLNANGHACRYDDDCKGDRVCGADGICAARKMTQTAGRGQDSGPSEDVNETVAACEGAACFDAGQDAQTPLVMDFCDAADRGCYESDFNARCPGSEWDTLGKALWSCESLKLSRDGLAGEVGWLHFFVAGWGSLGRPLPPLDFIWGPEIEIVGRSVLELQLDHRFNHESGPGLKVQIKLVPAGADPHANGALIWENTGPASRTNVQETSEVEVAKLPESVRERGRLVLLAGATGLVASPMSWDILGLRVVAK